MWVCVCSHGVQHQIKNDHTHEHAHIQQRGANTHMNTSMQIDIIHAPKFVHNPKITHEYAYILNAPDLWMQYTPGMVIADRYAIYIHVCSNPLSLAWRKRSSWSTATVKTDNNLRHLNIWALARMQLCHSEDTCSLQFLAQNVWFPTGTLQNRMHHPERAHLGVASAANLTSFGHDAPHTARPHQGLSHLAVDPRSISVWIFSKNGRKIGKFAVASPEQDLLMGSATRVSDFSENTPIWNNILHAKHSGWTKYRGNSRNLQEVWRKVWLG